MGERETVAYFNSLWGSKFTCGLLKLTGDFLHSVGWSKASVLCINCDFYCSRSLPRASRIHKDQDADSEAHTETPKRVIPRSHCHARAHAGTHTYTLTHNGQRTCLTYCRRAVRQTFRSS